MLLLGCAKTDTADDGTRLDDFSLPASYRWVEHATAPRPADSQDDYAFREYQAPAGADICADLEHAFRAWAHGKVVVSRGAGIGCQFTAVDRDRLTQRATATPAETDRVRVETWKHGPGF